MKKLFVQAAAYTVKNVPSSDFLKNLPEVIRKYADLDYSYEQTDTGCFLKPTFRNMPYRNSFIPEIDIMVSHNDLQTILHMKGQPIKSVRIFMAFGFSFLLISEVFLLALAITFKLNNLFSIFVPIVICAFGYLLCKISIKTTFESIVKAIQTELL